MHLHQVDYIQPDEESKKEMTSGEGKARIQWSILTL
jgi:hypothetical protein